MRALHGLMANESFKKIIANELNSHWVPDTSG